MYVNYLIYATIKGNKFTSQISVLMLEKKAATSRWTQVATPFPASSPIPRVVGIPR
eukprot:COSAG02_NODE_735_length_17872_cov_20.966860_5_plen_56_part_00